MVEASKFWDRMADRYYRQPIGDEAAYRTKLETTRKLLRPNMELLEFGCGTGGTAVIHAPYVRHIKAIDFSEAMLEKARERAKAAGVENVSFQRADISDLTADAGRYDMVLGMSVLHLLEDPDAAIAKVHTMLKPGGYFVSSTACLTDMVGMFSFLLPLGRAIGLLPTLNAMSGRELVGKLEAAGFEIEHRWQPKKGAALFLIGRKRI